MPSTRHARAALAATLATLLLAVAVGSASANRLSLGSSNFRAVWFALTFAAGSSTIACHVTLEGSFHSATIAKVPNALIGHVTRAVFNTCTGGGATVLSETLPWHVRYTGFTGTLPLITSVRLALVGVAFRIQREGFLACLAAATEAEPATVTADVEGGAISELSAESGAEIPVRGEFGLCSWASVLHYSGTASFTVLGTTTNIRLRLI